VSATFRPRARRALLEAFDYLIGQAGAEVGWRFLDAAQNSAEKLAAMPEMGVRCDFRDHSLRRLRRWPVQDFEQWLIFYLPTEQGVEVVHVLHGARDIPNALKE
jgi:toxin ParE1/3/4